MAMPLASMRKRLQLRIAGIGFDLTWEGARLADEPTWKFYKPFVMAEQQLSENHLDTRLQLHCGILPQLKAEGLIFDARRNHWRLSRAGSRYSFEVFSTVRPHLQTQLALLSTDFREGEVYVTPHTSSPHLAWSLTRLMRPLGELVMLNLLSQQHGVLLHALGVNDSGHGLLFVGASGAGKTTLGNLYKRFSDATILGDERVVVTYSEGQFWLSGTPWPGGGFTVSPGTVRLRNVFFLEHGASNRLIVDNQRSLYGLLFQQCFLPFWNSESLGFTMRFADELLQGVPAYRLSFVNDERVIEFLRSSLVREGDGSCLGAREIPH